MLLVANMRNGHRRNMTEQERALFGIDKLNVQRSDIRQSHTSTIRRAVQTVHQETNPRFHTLLRRFKEISGRPVLVNTSFAVRGEPIVCDVNDAFRCFMGTEIETLVVANCILEKPEQNPALKLDYKDAFELD